MRHPLRSALAALSLALATPLAGCGGSTSNSVSPGDTGGAHLIVFSSDRGNTAGQYDLYLYDLDQQGFRLMRGINSSTTADLHPSITSDGLVIAFQSNRGGTVGSDIYLYARALQQFVALTGVNTPADETEPSFTGDAVKLAFVQQAGGHTRIRLKDGLGDSLVALPGLDSIATFNDYSPSPDQTGQRIAFVSDRGGAPHVYVWDRSQRTMLALPDLTTGTNDVDPTLTPDGSLLCFASDRAGGAGGYDLYLYDLNAKAFVTLPANVNTTGNERRPAISRSGDVIVFQSDRAGGLGHNDLWNCRRSDSRVGTGTSESSAGDDIDPALLYP